MGNRPTCLILIWWFLVIGNVPTYAQTGLGALDPASVRLNGYGRFDVRGQYGDVPAQTTVLERDYEWWTPGRVGFWSYHIEAGGAAWFGERISVRLALTTTGDRGDRDFTVWGNDVRFDVRVKEASIRLDRVWSSRLSLEGGRQRVAYPLFTVYDYTGGRLTFAASPHLKIDWGQWQVFEGDILDPPGQNSDDIDLWGPRVRFTTARIYGAWYALVQSKAGGRDGIGHNVKIVGWRSEASWRSALTAGVAGVVQRGDTSDPAAGSRSVRAWAFRGRLRYAYTDAFAASVEYWSGSGDDPATPGVDEGFQQFGYRNTLDKSTLFYRPGLRDLRLVRGTVQGAVAGFNGRVEIARIGQQSGGAWVGTEIGVAVEYPYSPHVHLRWRWGVTGNGARMQVFEMSSGFGSSF